MLVTTTSHPVDRHLSVSSTEWEEPHPGRRLSCPVGPIVGERRGCDQSAQRFEGSGDSTVGTQDATSRKLQPTSTDMSSQAEAPVGTHQQTASASPSGIISPDSASAISGPLSESPSSALTYQTPDLCVDTNLANPDKMMVDADDNSPRSPSFWALSPVSEYEDLSHYLDGSSGSASTFGSEPPSSTVNLSNPAAYSHAAPFEDMYGWNAEWDRRLPSPESGVTPVVESSNSDAQSPFMARRGRAKRHGLLQRVLSVGKAPSRTSASRRARFSP